MSSNKINNWFMVEQSNLGTRVLLRNGMEFDMVCKIIKTYKKCYIALKEDVTTTPEDRHFAFHTFIEMYMRKHPHKFSKYFPNFMD